MSDQTSMPVRDEHVQQDNSDKTAAGMNGKTSATGRERAENREGEEPSGYRGENPATSGAGNTSITSSTPENAKGKLNPSAPGDTGTTPGSTGE
jgi:hypothetical protein